MHESEGQHGSPGVKDVELLSLEKSEPTRELCTRDFPAFVAHSSGEGMNVCYSVPLARSSVVLWLETQNPGVDFLDLNLTSTAY